jgi:hypothetical protein
MGQGAALKELLVDKDNQKETAGLDNGSAPEESKIIPTEIMRTIIRNQIIERDEQKIIN